jgi:PAS domain S-box-containing protein
MNISSKMRQGLTGKHTADMALRLKAAQVRQLYSQSRLGIFGAIVGALVLTAALWNEVPSWKLLAWLALFVPLQVWRQNLLTSYFKASPTDEDSVAWERRFLIGSVSTACLWGSAGILLFPENRIVEQCFFGVILGGVSASTAMAHSPVRVCYFSSVLLALVPFLVRLLWEGETMPVFLGLVGFGFLAAILGTGMSAHQLLIKSIILASEKDEFLQKLKDAQDNLETQVAERTASLIEANEKLQSEFAERRRFETALRESEEQYRMLVEHANEGIFLSQNGKPVFVNKACCNLTGYSEQELLSSEFIKLIHPDDQRQVIERYERRLQGDETPYSYSFRILARDGNTKWVHVNSASVKWKGINSILGFFTDITDRVLAEESMVHERRKFQVLAENAPFGMIMLDEADNFAYANPMFMEMFGYDMNEVPSGKAWLEKAYPDPQYRKEVIQAWFSDAKASKIEEPRPRTFTVTCKDGRRKSIHFMSVRLETGQHLVACEDVTLRKKLEEERDLLFNLSMDMLCVAGFDGFFKQVNPAWTKTLGWSSLELLSRPWMELVHPDDREDSLRAGRKLLSGEPVYDFENRYMCKDGTCRWMSWNSFPLIDEKRIFAVVRDTTDRKNAESALAENQSRLKAIQDHLPDMLWMKDFEGRFLLVNKAFSTACGRPSAEDVVGKTDFDIWSKNLAQLYTADDKNVMAKGTSKLVEEPIVDQGVTKWFETFKTPLFDANGAVVGTIGSARDITARKTVEQALRQSEEKYRKILETIADGYHEVDLKGNLTLVNDSLCDILGYSRDELIGKNYRELNDDHNAQELLHVYNEVFRSGISNPEFSYQVIRKDEVMRDVSVSIALIRDSAGSPIGFRGIFRDISERRHLEEQLRQAVKMEAIGRLAGGIAHDFNNLLTAILGYTTMVRLEVPEEGSARRKLDQISRAADRAADLTRQLLAFSRKQVLEVITINYNDLVRDIESMLRRIIGEDVELITELGKNIGNVRADQTQLE